MDFRTRNVEEMTPRIDLGSDSADGPHSFALIVGAMKCGTTSLFKYLAEHPAIAAAQVKEPGFFSRDDRLARGIEWYRSLWDWNSEVHRVALEASTEYTKYPHFPDAASRIAEFADRHGVAFRFIYLMRDPAERAVSQYMHERAGGWTSETIDDWLRADYPLKTFMYAAQLDRYARHFPDHSTLPLLFEDLRDHRWETVERVLTFLGLEPIDEETPALQEHYNSTAAKGILPLWWLRAERFGAGRLYRYLIPRRVRLATRSLLMRSGSRRTDFTLCQQHRLVDRLADDLERLESVYGVDINRWKSVRRARDREVEEAPPGRSGDGDV